MSVQERSHNGIPDCASKHRGNIYNIRGEECYFSLVDWRSILTREMELERVDGMSKSYKMVHNELVTTLTETIRVVVVPNAPSRNEKSNSLGLRLGRGEKAMPLIYGPIFTRWTRVN